MALDFGLAKALESVGANTDISSSPTFTHLGTQAGMILGTAAYMSPEQAKGKAIDRRSDIWAFGCVLFEMLTGKMVFSGETVTDTLAEIVKSEPNWNLLPPGTPRTIRTLLQRCLKKDPKQRLQAIGEARIVIEEVLGGKAPPDEQPTQTAASQERSYPLIGWIGGFAAGAVLVAAFAWWVTRSAAPAKTTVRPLTRLTFNGVSNYPAISPDGKLLAYQAAINGANSQIWVQQIGASKAIQVTHEVNGAFYPAFSPDGTQIAYSSAGGIFEATALGGDVRMVVNDGLYPTYISNGSAMLFWRSTGAHSYPFTIPRMGGTAVQIQPDFGFYFAAISPDGNKLLATAEQIGGPRQDLKHWWLMPISPGKPQGLASPPLLPDETYAPIPLLWTNSDKISGRQWIVFQRRIGGTRNLFRVAVKGDGTVTSPAEQLTFTADSWGPSISANGRMVFLSGDLSTNLWSIPIDANRAEVTGERQSVTQVEGLHDKNPSLSRDGRKVAYFSDRSVMVKDVDTGRETELAENVPAVPGTGPAISPDGSFVLYYMNSATALDWDLYAISSAGGAPRLVCRACGWPKGFSSDGSRVLTQRGYARDGLIGSPWWKWLPAR